MGDKGVAPGQTPRKALKSRPRSSAAAYLSKVPLQLLSWLNPIHSLGHSCHACHVAGLLSGHHPIGHTHHGSLHAPHIASRHGHGGNHSRGPWLSYHAYWWGHHAPHDAVRWCNPRETGVSCGICHLSRSHEHCCQENTHRGLSEERTQASPDTHWLLLSRKTFSTAKQQDGSSTSPSMVLIGPRSDLVIPPSEAGPALSQTPQKGDTRPYRSIALMALYLSADTLQPSPQRHIKVCFIRNIPDLRVN